MAYIEKKHAIHFGDLSAKFGEMKDVRKQMSILLDKTIEKLIELQVSYFDEIEKSTKRDWSVWLINTKSHIAIIASQDDLSMSIPEDGSFLSGICIQKGLDEKSARLRVDELGRAMGITIEKDITVS